MGHWNVEYLGSRERATDTKTFSFARPSDLTYLAGQFLYIVIPSAEDGGLRWIEHHFSFSSSPTESDIQLTTRLTGHEFKNVLDALPRGTKVRIAAPDGDFVLRDHMRKVAYVCGGVGVTPARSTIRWALDTRSDVDIVLLHGNRDPESTPFREEFEAIRSDRVRVVEVMSRPGPEWTGRKGHIDGDLVRAEVPDWKTRHFFVSGPPGMTGAIAQMLLNDVGVPSDHVIAEYFTGYE